MTAEQAVRHALEHVRALSSGVALPAWQRVTCSFHPDRPVAAQDGRLMIDSLVEQCWYHSQFVTGTSSGGLTAHPGGDRYDWESRIFGGAYDDAPAEHRPKYGALNHRRRAVGASSRFGSCHLRLAGHTLSRTTFCFPDSHADPRDFGVAEACGLTTLADRAGGDPLDDYVEAHIHGPVRLATDVEAVVLDPSFRGTRVERAAAGLPCPIEWHPGFVAHVEHIAAEPEYRGPHIVALARRYAVDGVLTPRIVGDVARAQREGSREIKQLWHCVARFGVVDEGVGAG